MGLGDLFRGLRGARDPESKIEMPRGAEPYFEYTIEALEMKDGAHWLTAAIIRKEFDDGIREHRMVRGDRHSDRVDARKFSVIKAQQIIDVEGDRLFDEPER